MLLGGEIRVGRLSNLTFVWTNEGVNANQISHLGLRELLKKLRDEVAVGAEHADEAERRLSIGGGSVWIVAHCGWLRGAMTPSLGCEPISTCRGPLRMQTLTL